MKKAYKEIGFKKLWRFFWLTPLLGFFNLLGFPNLRSGFLRLFRAKIGKNVVIHKIKLFNLYRGKFSNLIIGNNSFIGDDCLLDLADRITLGDHVTLAERVTVLTHTNVGYEDHPLQKFFPKKIGTVEFKDGSFVGANATILPGVAIGEKSFIAAGSVVTESVAPEFLAGGVPAKLIRKIDDKNEN
jgi:acetyltransferase-like isoleucine patch superfamily enzyme